MSGEIHSGVQDMNAMYVDNTVEDVKESFGDVDNATQLCCDICNIKVTSSKILQRHLDGKKHKMRVERRGKSFRCELCDLTANSETQLNIHLSSSRHKSKLLKQEYNEFTDYTANVKGIWIIIFCVVCIFLNLFLLFKLVL